ncbi:Hypothetical predicted protein, partial [Pelobates cultripes]
MNADGTGYTPIPNLVTRWDQQNHLLDQCAQALQTILICNAHLDPAPGQPAISAASASLPVRTPVVASKPAAARGMTG